MFSVLLASLFVRLGFRLLCARLAVHSAFAVHSVFGSLISKPRRQRQRVQWLSTYVITLCSFLYRSLQNNNMKIKERT